MEDQKQTSFTFEIDNFSEKEAAISSPIFVSGGCEWYVKVYPMGNDIEDHLSVYLTVANPEYLRLGWKRRANFSFTVLNQLGKELFRASKGCKLFSAQFSCRGYQKLLPLSKLKEKGCLENNKLIIKVKVKVVEVEVTGKEMLDYKGFQNFYSQVQQLEEHIKNLELMLELERKKVDNAVVTRVQELVKNVELMESKLAEVSLERNKSDDDVVSRVQKLEESVKNLEPMELVFKLDSLKSKLEEVSLEGKKANDADGSRVQQLEERIKNLELMVLGSLKSKLEKVSLEKKKKTDDVDGTRVQQLEESVKNLEKMVLDLKVELEKEKDESSADGFLLVA